MGTPLSREEAALTRGGAASVAEWRWRRALFLFWQGAVALVFVALSGLALPFSVMLIPMGAVAGAMAVVKVLFKPEPSLRRRDLPAFVCVLVIFLPFFWFGFAAPMRALVVAAHGLAPWIPADAALEKIFGGDRVLYAHADLLAGACGVLLGVAVLLRDGAWRLGQLRQLRIIPRSKARSTALGLAELRGVARRAPGAPQERIGNRGRSDDGWDAIPRGALLAFCGAYAENQDGQLLAPFFLEDETGRILVDPRGASIRRGIWSATFGQRLCEVVLSRRVVRRAHGVSEQCWLEDGDPVYVVGNVEQNEAAGLRAANGEALVVRRSTQRRPPTLLERALAADPRLLESFSWRDVFFLSDSAEGGARRHMWRGLRHSALLALLAVTASLWLLGQALEVTSPLPPAELLQRLF